MHAAGVRNDLNGCVGHIPAIRDLIETNGDDDSEAESYMHGRTEGVDPETKTRAYTWCRDFLSGAWKSIPEEDFEISIIR